MARKICVMTSAHPTFDVRIFHKECKSLARANYEVTLIASGNEDGVHDGVELLHLPHWNNRRDRFLRGSLAIYKIARKVDADIYHFHDPELIPAALLLQLSGKRVIYDIHEDLPRTVSYKTYIPRRFRGLVARVAEAIESTAAARFSALVVATPGIGDRFRKLNENVAVVNNYPKIEELECGRVAGAMTRDTSFLYVGMRITRARGADEMVRAIGLLPAKLQARLRLVGAWDPSGLPAHLSNIPGWKCTDFTGPLDRAEVANELRRACAGLVILHPEPNYIASQPVKLFEYMCAGIPVIASDFPFCREVVTQARCGFLVNPLNPREIADAMEFFLTHRDEAEEMGQRGHEAVREKYNWAKEQNSLLQLYAQLCRHDAAYERSLVDTEVNP